VDAIMAWLPELSPADIAVAVVWALSVTACVLAVFCQWRPR
jgi:hypothetical protein